MELFYQMPVIHFKVSIAVAVPLLLVPRIMQSINSRDAED